MLFYVHLYEKYDKLGILPQPCKQSQNIYRTNTLYIFTLPKKRGLLPTFLWHKYCKNTMLLNLEPYIPGV